MSAVPVITMTGWSNSGKTTFTTHVVEQLTDMGIRVGVIKHHGHKTGGVDVEGKDSWKYAQAGANPVILSASDQYAIFVSTPQGELSREELVAKIADEVDMVVVEGFRAEADGAVELLSSLLEMRAKQNDVAAPLIATHSELSKLVRGHREDLALMEGWRYDIVGRELIDLLEGRLALYLDGGAIEVARREA